MQVNARHVLEPSTVAEMQLGQAVYELHSVPTVLEHFEFPMDNSAEWQSLFEAVKSDFGTMFMAIVKVDKLGHSYQEIEWRLRKANAKCMLIGRVENDPNGEARSLTGESKAYGLWISRRDPISAMRELLLYSNSYAHNFAKLAQTGIVCVKDGRLDQFKADAEKQNERNKMQGKDLEWTLFDKPIPLDK